MINSSSEITQDLLNQLASYPNWSQDDLRDLGYWRMGYSVFQGNLGLGLCRAVVSCKSNRIAQEVATRLEELRINQPVKG